MHRALDCVWYMNKKSFLLTSFLLISVVYLSYTFNSCLVNNLNKVFKQQRSHAFLSTSRAAVTVSTKESGSPAPKKETVVRVVPLTWMGLQVADGTNKEMDDEIAHAPLSKIFCHRSEVVFTQAGNETNELVDGAPKYRFLRHQSLRPTRKLPDALIIGVKKGGTRALLEFIRLHPDVRAAGNEIHFFDRFYQKGFHWYRQRMPPTLEGQVTMEKTPSYFVTRDVPQKVHQMNPSTKLLVVVRDPVTRAISDYTQVSSKKPGMARFEELAFLNGTDRSGLVDTSWGPIKIGVYARHLERWLQCFPIKQMLFVSGERLIVDPAMEMARVQDFLGLKRVITEKHFYFNSTKGFPCLMKSEGRSSPHCLGKTKGRNHPFIDPAAVQRLREFYRPFNARFYQLTGINFGWP